MNDIDACMESMSDGGEEGGDLIKEVYEYMTQRRYPLGCMEGRKRTIRRKANKFVLKDGELYFKKKQKGKVSCLECTRFQGRNVCVLT